VSRSIRPGSLLVLGVLDFLGSAWGMITLLGQLWLRLRPPGGGRGRLPADVDPAAILASYPIWYRWLEPVDTALCAVLLLFAGIGAMTMRTWSGRWCATVYAVLSIAWTIAALTVESRAGQGAYADLATALALIFPLITLVWVNVVLRDVWRGERLADGVAEAPPAGGWTLPGGATRLALACAQSLRQSLRGSMGLGLLLTTLMGGLIGVLAIATIEEKVRDNLDLSGRTMHSAHHWLAKNLLAGWYRAGETPGIDYLAWADHLVVARPALLSFSWLLLSMLVPLLVVLGGCNLIATDAAHRGFRFLLLRTDRASLWFGRFLGAAALVAISLLLLVACTGWLVGRSEVDLELGSRAVPLATTLRSTAWAYVALLLTALPYLALAQWCSSLINSGIGALAVVSVAVGAVPGLAFALASQWPPLWHVMHLMPWGSQVLLFHPHAGVAAGAAAACLAYTALFLGLGWRHFRGRDL